MNQLLTHRISAVSRIGKIIISSDAIDEPNEEINNATEPSGSSDAIKMRSVLCCA